MKHREYQLPIALGCLLVEDVTVGQGISMFSALMNLMDVLHPTGL